MHKDGGEVGGIAVRLIMLKLAHENVFVWKEEGV